MIEQSSSVVLLKVCIIDNWVQYNCPPVGKFSNKKKMSYLLAKQFGRKKKKMRNFLFGTANFRIFFFPISDKFGTKHFQSKFSPTKDG